MNRGRNRTAALDPRHNRWVMNRRTFLRASATTAAALVSGSLSCCSLNRCRGGAVRFGIVTDCHYADAEAKGSRFYRRSLDKLAECVDVMNDQHVDFLIELGDFKDQDTPPVEERTLAYLEEIEAVFQRFNGPTYHVLGNHDLDSISKEQFLGRVANTSVDPARSYYSFDLGSMRFIVLDANYKSDAADYDHGNFNWTDANIPPAELAWLQQTVSDAPGPCIVFIHQLLDGVGSVYVKNGEEVRHILQESKKVLAVFQGHHHAGSYSFIESIHYYTLKAVVEGPGEEDNSYAIVEADPAGRITVTGYRKAVSKRLGPDSDGG